MGPKTEAIYPLCSTLPAYPIVSMFWMFGNLVPERSVHETWNQCRRRKVERQESMVAEVKVLPNFAYPYDEERRGEVAEYLLHLSDVVDDLVEFCRDLARVGVVCGAVRRLVNGWHENVSESTN
jgi:hypothetical protein